MFDGMHNIFKVTACYNSTYHYRMGWVLVVVAGGGGGLGEGTSVFSENTAIFTIVLLNPCSRRTEFSSIAITLNCSSSTFSSIAIELKVNGKCVLSAFK